MTGQVKEELLTRLGEFGVRVDGGRVQFLPELLPPEELFDEPGRLEYVDAAGHEATLDVPAGGVAFTFCQVPVIYRFGSPERSVTILRGPAAETIPGDTAARRRGRGAVSPHGITDCDRGGHSWISCVWISCVWR